MKSQEIFLSLIGGNPAYLKLKTDPTICTFKNLENILKPGENLPKTFGNPVLIKFKLTQVKCITLKIPKRH